MPATVLRDTDEAQRFLLQGLWLQRAVPPTAGSVRYVLEWALEVAASGQPMLPVGMIADLGHVAFGHDRDARAVKDAPAVPGLPAGLIRTYEDHVLGKVYADALFERAADALRRYVGRDRVVGLAYLVRQFRERGGIGGVELSPGVIRSLLERTPDDLLRRGWESLGDDGPMPLLVDLYLETTGAARRLPDLLEPADAVALEQRTALADMGQYVAHRQALQTAERLEAGLPKRKVRPLAGRREVPTRILDEDTYPVGGFTSISTKGSVESLLHSQLAYIESEPDRRPDLFDVKFLRDELYYYSRDENQFLRRRRSFLFVLHPDLIKTRFNDPGLPVQRIVMVVGLLAAAVNKLTEWLGDDALTFEFLLVGAKDPMPLAHEAALLEMLFREQIANESVLVRHLADPPASYADRRAESSMCQVLHVSVGGALPTTATAVSTALVVADATPQLILDRPDPRPDNDDIAEAWTATLERLLSMWV